MKLKVIILSVGLTLSILFNPQAEAGTKFGPQATRLHNEHAFISKNKAPDYWALSPYYLPQQDGRSCSVASITMVLNAARADEVLSSSDELVTQKSALKKLNHRISDLFPLPSHHTSHTPFIFVAAEN